MEWVKAFDLFLFDFDGLLVDTEHIHYQAYLNMAKRYGAELKWTFNEFLAFAHLGSKEIEEAFQTNYPQLFENRNWSALYQEKKSIYLDLLQTGKLNLMPGVYQLLQEIKTQRKTSCVVTNSFKEQIDFIRAKVDALDAIDHFITRESYTELKPHPECYLKAIQLYGKKGDRIIGFEDSARGIKALEKTPALPVLVCHANYPLLNMVSDLNICHYESMDLIPSSGPSLERAL